MGHTTRRLFLPIGIAVRYRVAVGYRVDVGHRVDVHLRVPQEVVGSRVDVLNASHEVVLLLFDPHTPTAREVILRGRDQHEHVAVFKVCCEHRQHVSIVKDICLRHCGVLQVILNTVVQPDAGCEYDCG